MLTPPEMCRSWASALLHETPYASITSCHQEGCSKDGLTERSVSNAAIDFRTSLAEVMWAYLQDNTLDATSLGYEAPTKVASASGTMCYGCRQH